MVLSADRSAEASAGLRWGSAPSSVSTGTGTGKKCVESAAQVAGVPWRLPRVMERWDHVYLPELGAPTVTGVRRPVRRTHQQTTSHESEGH